MARTLETEQLTSRIDPDRLDFSSTDELEPLPGIVGQERAVRALHFGIATEGDGFNVFVCGPPGIGKMTSVKSFLEEVAARRPTPSDWCFVHNFEDPYEPDVLQLPAGTGAEFRSDMDHLREYIQTDLLKSFESDSYSSEREDKMNEIQRTREEIFRRLQEEAKEEGFSLQSTPMGIALVPLDENGEPMDDEAFNQLPEERRNQIQQKQQEFMERIKKANKEIRSKQREGQDSIRELDQRVVMNTLGGLIEDLTDKYSDYAEVAAYLERVQQDVLDNIEELRRIDQLEKSQSGQNPQLRQQMEAGRDRILRKYRVNVAVDNRNTEGAPMVVELNPNYVNLIGRIEKEMQMGALNTDFSMLRAGSLLRAIGGFLVIQADDLLRQPHAWEALKRSLRSKEVRIEEPGEQLGLMTIKSLRPQAIPLDVKVVLVGRPILYQLLHAYDMEFSELFKVKADYDLRMSTTDDNIERFARFLRTLGEKETILDVDRDGVAKLLEHASRLAEHQDDLSTNFGAIADVVREANYWARSGKAEIIGAEHVRTALEEKVYRSRLIQDRLQELIDRGAVLIDVDGTSPGQVNGLSVVMLGDYRFGRPNRITARVGPGREGVVDIEREAKIGGPVHTKGVMILSGYLEGTYARDRLPSLRAKLVFEQSYGGVEGDSASSAELYALLSELSGLPIRQDIAVTGSVNQHGEVQAVGGINEKIEGFFEVCRMKGLTGRQGVVIPSSNAQNLMLKEEVLRSVEESEFSIWTLDTIDEGIELLTGVSAGEPSEEGEYSADSVNGRIMKRLEAFEQRLREAGPGLPGKPSDDDV